MQFTVLNWVNLLISRLNITYFTDELMKYITEINFGEKWIRIFTT